MEPMQIGIIIKPNGLREKTTRTDVFATLLVLYEIAAEIGRSGYEKPGLFSLPGSLEKMQKDAIPC